MIRVGILNVTGYLGIETVRLLANHPEAQVVSVTGRSAAGKRLAEVYPHARGIDLTIEDELGDVDVVVSALPHAAAAEALLPYIRRGLPVIDLSADFRLKDAAEYERWYGVAHPAPELLDQAVFGLPELHRDEIRRARIVGTPGCFPTGAILSLAPLVREGVIEDDIVVDAKTGLSGAGRTLGLAVHFSEADESVDAYGLGGHRHLPEIQQELGRLREGPAPAVTFVPHHIPMVRGILGTSYAKARPGTLPLGRETEALRELFRDFYDGHPFAVVAETPPATKHVAGTNDCLLYPLYDARTGRVIVISALDNLVKGGAGQGVQCLNLMFGLPEDMGLRA
ncbi:MAG TPA: N-acetyl-gamma-glutamyl-phosphate reductase, partial [Dehalococcoidia bacterium]|nr:N-acetyl-gamma-glutamyl-phosphate reductase [Dehalococcoidia bacterium]